MSLCGFKNPTTHISQSRLHTQET